MFKSEYTCLFMEVGLEEAQRGESRRCTGVLSHMSCQISVEATGQAEDSHPESPSGAPQTQGGECGVRLLRSDIRVTKGRLLKILSVFLPCIHCEENILIFTSI